jgi:hypothetical protein
MSNTLKKKTRDGIEPSSSNLQLDTWPKMLYSRVLIIGLEPILLK